MYTFFLFDPRFLFEYYDQPFEEMDEWIKIDITNFNFRLTTQIYNVTKSIMGHGYAQECQPYVCMQAQ